MAPRYTEIRKRDSVATVAAYVDGVNLFCGLKRSYGRRFLWLDVVDLVRRLRPEDQLIVVRYFSAIVKGDPPAAERQTSYLAALRARNGRPLRVHLGRFKSRGREGWVEKETYVALSALMVADAALGLADTTLVISADTDLAPALSAVRSVAPGQRIYLALPPGNGRPSRLLASAGDVGRFFLRESVLRAAQLPPAVADPAGGRIHRRPETWR